MATCELLVLLAALILVTGSKFNSLKVKSSPFDYHDLPWSLSEALALKMSQGTPPMRDHELNLQLVSWPDDPRFFLLYDAQGTIAGVRFGFRKNDVNRMVFSKGDFFSRTFHSFVLWIKSFFEKMSSFFGPKKKHRASEYDVVRKMKPVDPKYKYSFPSEMYRTGTFWGETIWYTSVIFASPDVIMKGGRPNLKKGRDDVLTDLYFWADSAWRQVPQSECDTQVELKEQACYMGKNYYYKLDDSTSCAQWQGFSVTYEQGVLASFGVTVFGSFVSTFFTPSYYEHPDFDLVKMILPHRPSCVDEWLPFTGVTSVQVFLVDDPLAITCPRFSWRSKNCH